jgi:hypothetical protein
MKKCIQLLIVLMVFQSCYTVQKAQKQIIRAHVSYPELMPDFCSSTFPTKDSTVVKTKFIKGKETFKTDTITIDCDSVVSDFDKENKVFIKREEGFRVDTVYIDKIKTVRDTALEIKLQNDINKQKNDIRKLKADLLQAENSSNGWMQRCWGLIILLIFIIYLAVKKGG